MFSSTITIAVIAAWIYAIYVDAASNQIGFLLADFLFPPFGIVRGVFLFLYGAV